MDLSASKDFLELISGSCDTVFDFRVIFDNKENIGNHLPAIRMRGRFEDLKDWLSEKNNEGYGVFFSVNESDGEGVEKSNIKRIRAIWGDFDHVDRLPDLKAEPSCVVRTKNGWHVYYVLEDPSHVLEWGEGMNRRLVECLGSDRVARDIARVLRVPGFYHRKGEPFLVTMEELSGTLYTPDELEGYYGPPLQEQRKKKASGGVRVAKEDTPRGLELVRDAHRELCEVEVGAGVRNHTMNQQAFKVGQVVGAGMITEDTAKSYLYDAIHNNYTDCESEAERTMESGFNSGLAQPWEEDDSFEIKSFVSRHRDAFLGSVKKESNLNKVLLGGLLTGPAATETMLKELEWRIEMGFHPAPGPLAQLDAVLGGGVPAGAVTLLGAPPGQGKSSLALDWAIGCAERGVPSIFCSLELSALDLYGRAATQRHGVNWLEVRMGKHLEDFRETMAWLSGIPFSVATRDTLHGPAVLASYIKQERERHGKTPVVVIDYIQLMVNTSDPEKRTAMDAVSVALREVAKETAANIICITSIGRAGYSFIPDDSNYPDTGLVLKMAKETGQLEYDAEVVMGIQLGHVDPDDGYQYGWVCVGKNRSGGSVGFVGVRYEGVSGRFFDASEDDVVRSWSKLKEIERSASEKRKEDREAEQEDKVIAAVRSGSMRNERDIERACGLGRSMCSKTVARLKRQGVLVPPTKREPYYHLRGE